MFGVSGTELLVIMVVVLIVFGPKDLPKAMRSAGSFMRTFNRMKGEYRRQFDQALRDVESELEVKEIRNSVEAAIKGSPAPVKSPLRQEEQSSDRRTSPDQTDREPGEPTYRDAKES